MFDKNKILSQLRDMDPAVVADMVHQALMDAGFEYDDRGNGIIFSGLSKIEEGKEDEDN